MAKDKPFHNPFGGLKLQKAEPRPTNYGSGAIWKFVQLVGPAYAGAVTQPGQPGEAHVYADI